MLWPFFLRELTSEWEATRIEALHWISALLARYRSEVNRFMILFIFVCSSFDEKIMFLCFTLGGKACIYKL